MFSKGQCHEIFGKRRGKLDVKLFLKLVHKKCFFNSNFVLEHGFKQYKINS